MLNSKFNEKTNLQVIALTLVFLIILAANIAFNKYEKPNQNETKTENITLITKNDKEDSTVSIYNAQYVIEQFSARGMTDVKLVETEINDLSNYNVFNIGQGNYAFMEKGKDTLFIGGAIRLSDFNDLTVEIKSSAFESIVAKIPNEIFIDYPAKNEKAVMYVFTDTTCPYCKQFHSSIETLNNKGVTIKYIPFPRDFGNGDKSISLTHFEEIYCSENQKAAFDKFFDNPKEKGTLTCKDSRRKTEAGFMIGLEANVNGTPTWLIKTPSRSLQGAGAIQPEEVEQIINYLNTPL